MLSLSRHLLNPIQAVCADRWNRPPVSSGVSCARRIMVLALLLGFSLSAQALDLNQATEAELDGLLGFGPAFTSRVMQARAERPFSDWRDFMRRVKGVKSATALRLSRQGVHIHQQPFTSAAERVTRDE